MFIYILTFCAKNIYFYTSLGTVMSRLTLTQISAQPGLQFSTLVPQKKKKKKSQGGVRFGCCRRGLLRFLDESQGKPNNLKREGGVRLRKKLGRKGAVAVKTHPHRKLCIKKKDRRVCRREGIREHFLDAFSCHYLFFSVYYLQRQRL